MKKHLEQEFKKELSLVYDVSFDKITILNYEYVGDISYGYSGSTNNTNCVILNLYVVSFSIKKFLKKTIEGKVKIPVDSDEFKIYLRTFKIKKLNECG